MNNPTPVEKASHANKQLAFNACKGGLLCMCGKALPNAEVHIRRHAGEHCNSSAGAALAGTCFTGVWVILIPCVSS